MAYLSSYSPSGTSKTEGKFQTGGCSAVRTTADTQRTNACKTGFVCRHQIRITE